MRWLSINQVNQLIKNKMYEIESGKIFEKNSGREVGVYRNNKFIQHQNYIPSENISDELKCFDNDWENCDKSW